MINLWSLSYGLYAIGVEGEKHPSACIVNTVLQVTASPAILAVSVNHDNYTHQQIMKYKRFTVSVLSEDTSRRCHRRLRVYLGAGYGKAKKYPL